MAIEMRRENMLGYRARREQRGLLQQERVVHKVSKLKYLYKTITHIFVLIMLCFVLTTIVCKY